MQRSDNLEEEVDFGGDADTEALVASGEKQATVFYDEHQVENPYSAVNYVDPSGLTSGESNLLDGA